MGKVMMVGFIEMEIVDDLSLFSFVFVDRSSQVL